eukprot:TRINITY_DN5606_c0_g1_i2.p1 TRINITY_DN5606_c0_g1~~TRINITY_DN5606_c0_g1_i2.p1  ORF type:complete len:518 (-),score=92.99 TRINITY_DN5606_c0_g1_i2:490-2043(-)
MAEWAAVPSCAYLQLQRSCFRPRNFMPQNVYIRIERRKYFGGKYRSVLSLSHDLCELSLPVSATREGRNLTKFSSRCRCLGSLVNPENATPLSWVSVVDQVLLMATVAFAYMAGVIPSKKVYFNARKNLPDQVAHTENSTSSGSAMKSENQTNLYAWDEVKRKLLDALDVIEHDGSLASQAVECENNSSKNPLSLYAISEGPRLRLLWATLQQLQKEVSNISGADEALNGDIWMVLSSESIRRSVQPICLRWLEEELSLENKKQDKAVLTKMFERLKGDDTILKSIKKLGKEDLYADLLFFLRFGSLRPDCHYDSKLLTRHGVEILEDLVINLAEGITSMYLELISVDSNMSSEMSRLDLVLCSLSTRALQRLRNEVALNQWLHQNIESVVSMYEDRFDMFALQTKLLECLNEKETDRLSWWKKIAFHKPAATASPLCYIFIRQMSLPVKRTKELRALSGWRYYFSLFLEFSDITMPLVRAVVAKVSSAVSFFLVCLIGRSLGLIYTGIRQALGWGK